ncbi:MAG: DUF3179 domain-containing protein [Acidobacteria bacterium]|nr:DUF3179 domain-containing protein [Acidobacteriota bacterium]
MIFLLAASLAGSAQEPFQRDKIMVSRGRTPYVPLDDPEVISAARARYLGDEEEVLGATIAGESRAYPLRLMAWHHVANDSVGPAHYPLAVVY